jgi:hypothetical protein
MRWLNAATAFAVPFLVVVAIGSTMLDADGTVPALGGPAMDELRRFVGERAGLLDRYAPDASEQPVSASVPHLALERFDRRGREPGGQPWYQLSSPPTGYICGIIRRGEPATPLKPPGGAKPDLVLPLPGGWLYWETRLAAPAGPESPRKSP